MVTIKYVWNQLNPAGLVDYGVTVKGKMTGNLFFPDAATKLAALDAAGVALHSANTAIPYSSFSVKEKVKIWKTKMKTVAMYVQEIANDATSELALEMIESAGLTSWVTGSKNIPNLDVKMGVEVNSVEIHRRRQERERVALIFQQCTDPSNEENWRQIRVTNGLGTIIVRELTPAVRYYFRVAAVIGDIQQEFSAPVFIIVS